MMLLPLLLLFLFPDAAYGHGYMMSPRARNYVAYVDGPSWISPNDPLASTLPKKDYCPHCLNRGGSCGSEGEGQINYNAPKNTIGGDMPLNVQATYVQGQTIEIKSVLTAHHWGHYALRACPLANHGDVPSESCFESHKLEFVEDVLYGAPKDLNYPERAYIAPPGISNKVQGESPPGMVFRHR